MGALWDMKVNGRGNVMCFGNEMEYWSHFECLSAQQRRSVGKFFKKSVLIFEVLEASVVEHV